MRHFYVCKSVNMQMTSQIRTTTVKIRKLDIFFDNLG